MKNKNTKQRLFEVMSRLNPDFIINEEVKKSSYNKGIYDDIKTLIGNGDSLSDSEIQQIANSYDVDVDEINQTLDYVITQREEEAPDVPDNSSEILDKDDFFKFIENNPQKGSNATVEYASFLNAKLAKPKSNPMVNKFIKFTKYNIDWGKTYKEDVMRKNPDWDIQKRKGGYTEFGGGYNGLKLDRNQKEVFDIVPINPKSLIIVLDDNGKVIDQLKSRELKDKYEQYFQPSFFKKYTSGSGSTLRALKLAAINRIAAGGKVWLNNSLIEPFNQYKEYFNKIDKSM